MPYNSMQIIPADTTERAFITEAQEGGVYLTLIDCDGNATEVLFASADVTELIDALREISEASK